MKDAARAVSIELAPDKIRHSFHLRLDKQSLTQQVLNAHGI
jgi:RNA binding exosome subunit